MFKNNFTDFFKDSEGQFSSMRLGFLLWIIGVFIVWSFVSFKSKTLVAIPEPVVEILGVCVLGKVGQSWTEGRTPDK